MLSGGLIPSVHPGIGISDMARPKKTTENVVAEVVRLFHEGELEKLIAYRVGLAITTITVVLRSNGLYRCERYRERNENAIRAN